MAWRVLYLSPPHWINLAAGAVGVIGAIVLFRGSFAFESFPYWTDDKLIAEQAARNLRRKRLQKVGLDFIMASFALQAIAQFFRLSDATPQRSAFASE